MKTSTTRPRILIVSMIIHWFTDRVRCLIPILTVLVWGNQTAFCTPVLSIAVAGSQSVLYWPYGSGNFAVESVTNLTATNWTVASDAVPVSACTVSNILPTRYFRLVNADPVAPAGMVLIPAGVFVMGDSLDGLADATPTNVMVSAFFMESNLVSHSLWQTVRTYALSHGYGMNAGAGKATNHPVQTVTWFDCIKWCNARSQRDGLIPAYYTDAGLTLVYTNGTTTPFVKWTANGYRLPTEAEWEKAARGGLNQRRFPWGNLISEQQANYYGTSSYAYDLYLDYNPELPAYNPYGDPLGNDPHTTPCGIFDCNSYGLYDMAGNVFEWCWDWYGTPYAGGTDPQGPATGNYRAYRGGGWASDASYARVAFRYSGVPTIATFNDVGFRCVRGH